MSLLQQQFLQRAPCRVHGAAQPCQVCAQLRWAEEERARHARHSQRDPNGPTPRDERYMGTDEPFNP